MMLFMHAVLYTLDWQRALSKLTMTIAMIQIKTSSCEDKNTILTNMKHFLMYVLALMNALLDGISSVAASVIFSHLLISGDVESNPGPGRYPGELLRMYICTKLSSVLKYSVICTKFNNTSFCVMHTDLDYHSVDANQILGQFFYTIMCSDLTLLYR